MSQEVIEGEIVQFEPMTNLKIKARDSDGRNIRTPEQIENDHQAAEMKTRGATFRQIGQRFGLTPQGAYSMVQRAIDDIPREATAELIALELAKFDNLEQRYYGIMEKAHLHLTIKGDVVDFEDDALVMKAMDGLMRVADRRAKLLGLNAPTRTELTGVMVNVNVEDNSEKSKAAVYGLLNRLRPDE